MFCVECGKTEKLYVNLCKDCFLKRHELTGIREVVDVVLCSNCDSIKKGERWQDFEDFDEELLRVLRDNLTLEQGAEIKKLDFTEEYEDERNIAVNLSVKITIHGLEAEKDLRTKIRLSTSSCDRCSKIHGRYYEAIIQIRGTDKRLSGGELEDIESEISDMVGIIQKKNREVFIGRIEKIHGGRDFYLSSNNSARIVAKDIAAAYGAHLSSSPSLYGRKDGKDVHRVTYLVRLPKFRVNDFIELDGKLYLVRRIGERAASVTHLESDENLNIKLKELNNCKVLGGEEMIKSAVLVAESEKEIQILDPDTLKTIEILKTKSYKPGKESVKVVKIGEELFLLQ